MKLLRKKILPEYFEEVKNRNKNFELCKDEDDAQAWDMIDLEEWNPEIGYTGEYATHQISYVMRNVPEYGLMDGYCIIGW